MLFMQNARINVSTKHYYRKFKQLSCIIHVRVVLSNNGLCRN